MPRNATDGWAAANSFSNRSRNAATCGGKRDDLRRKRWWRAATANARQHHPSPTQSHMRWLSEAPRAELSERAERPEPLAGVRRRRLRCDRHGTRPSGEPVGGCPQDALDSPTSPSGKLAGAAELRQSGAAGFRSVSEPVARSLRKSDTAQPTGGPSLDPTRPDQSRRAASQGHPAVPPAHPR